MRDADKVKYIVKMYIKLCCEKPKKFDRFIDSFNVNKLWESDDKDSYNSFFECSLYDDILFKATYDKRSYMWSVTSFRRYHTALATSEFADELKKEELYRIQGG